MSVRVAFFRPPVWAIARISIALAALVFALSSLSSFAQQTSTPASQPDPQPQSAPQQPVPAQPEPQQPAPTPSPAAAATAAQPDAATPATPVAAKLATGLQRPADAHQTGAVTEEEIKQLLVGNVLYLRGGYLGDSLHFDVHGQLVDRAAQAPYTLSLVEIGKVSLNKHRLELEGLRYGLHFEDALPTVDPMQAADKVRITPRKKTLKITFDRLEVESPKKEKQKKESRKSAPATASTTAPAARAPQPVVPAAAPTDPRKTTSTAVANQALRNAVDRALAHGLDERLMASLPDFWKLYYQAAASGTDYRPRDPATLRQNSVDQKARLLTTFEPPSNDFAQANGVAGIAVYHVVLGPDGKPAEIAAARPIGFGLDENAVDSIRKASYQPAMKDGKPVSVMLDVIVRFRIYSNRTAIAATPETAKSLPDTATLPGPYSAKQP